MMNVLWSTFTFANGATIIVDYSADTILPTSHATREKNTLSLEQWGLLSMPTNNQLNVSNAQKEILYWHNIFGHYNIRKTQKVMKVNGEDFQPIIQTKVPRSATCSIPLCWAWLHGKGRRDPKRVWITKSSAVSTTFSLWIKAEPPKLYNHLREGLESRGSQKSNHDDCLFSNGKIVVLFWVDHWIIYTRKHKEIYILIDSLKMSFCWRGKTTRQAS